MKVVPWNERRELVRSWLNNGDLTLLPESGWVVDDCVVGFLYCTAVPVAFVDVFTSDPNASSKRKYRAFEVLADTMKAGAKAAGVRMLVGMTHVRGLGRLLEKHGAVEGTPGYYIHLIED